MGLRVHVSLISPNDSETEDEEMFTATSTNTGPTAVTTFLSPVVSLHSSLWQLFDVKQH